MPRSARRRQGPEGLLQVAVVRQARALGYQAVYHTVMSQLSAPGYPDLHLVRLAIENGRVMSTRDLYVELKGPKGVVSPEQELWLDVLALLGHEVYVWQVSKGADGALDYDAQRIADVLWAARDPGPGAFGRWIVRGADVEPASLQRWSRLGITEEQRW